MSTDFERRQIAREAKAIVALAFRNGSIEELHAGRSCPTCTGRTGFSRITDDEMKAIMKNAQKEEFKHFSMDLEWLLRNTSEWRETARRVLFTKGDIVEAGGGPAKCLVTRTLIEGFLSSSSLGGSSYEAINTTYGDNSGNVSGGLQLTQTAFDNYSHGTRLSDSGVQAVVSSAISSARLRTSTIFPANNSRL